VRVVVETVVAIGWDLTSSPENSLGDESRYPLLDREERSSAPVRAILKDRHLHSGLVAATMTLSTLNVFINRFGSPRRTFAK